MIFFSLVVAWAHWTNRLRPARARAAVSSWDFPGARECVMQITQVPVSRTGMLIRRPVAEVFEAFIDPDITSRFWFTKGSRRLAAGERVRWDWEMFGASAEVAVKEIEANKRILVGWSSPGSDPTAVEWLFAPGAGDTTFVTVTESGFTGDGDGVIRKALDSQGGFLSA